MTIEDNSLIFGELYKKTKSETAKFFSAFKNQYLQRHFCVNFKRREVTSRPDFHPESKVKTIPFQKIVGVLPDNGKKMVDINQCSHSFQFSLIETSIKTDLYARSKVE